MEVVESEEKAIDFQLLDETIRLSFPFGINVRGDFHPYNEMIAISKLHCFTRIKYIYARHSLGSLGGGNHFIERLTGMKKVVSIL